MKLLFAAIPVAGHLNPLLSIVRMARARGHDVLFATAGHLAPAVKAAGAMPIPLAPGADLDLRRIEELFPERASILPGPARLKHDMIRTFIDPMPAQAKTLRDAVAVHAPDLIVADSFFFGTTPLFLDRARPRPPIVGCGVTFLPLAREDGAPVGLGLPPSDDECERARYHAIAAGVAVELEAPLQAAFNARLSSMRLPPLPHGFWSSRVLLADAYLQPTVPSFEYGFDLPPSLRFVGALPPPPPPPPTLTRPDWWGDLDDGRRVVLVTQGTAANFDFSELVEPTIAALADRNDLLVVVTTGGRPVTDIRGPLPANVRIEPFLDYAGLMPRLDALVTNGGYGTVSLALQAGVPVVAAGRTEGKAEIGARVAWSGVGIELPTQTPEADDLRAAVNRVLAEPRFRARASALAAEFAAIDTERTIFQVFEALVHGVGRPAGPGGPTTCVVPAFADADRA